MKDNFYVSNGNGGIGFIPFPTLDSDKTKIAPLISQELNQDQLMLKIKTGNIIQQDINKDNELLNRSWTDRELENEDIFQNSRNEREELW